MYQQILTWFMFFLSAPLTAMSLPSDSEESPVPSLPTSMSMTKADADAGIRSLLSPMLESEAPVWPRRFGVEDVSLLYARELHLPHAPTTDKIRISPTEDTDIRQLLAQMLVREREVWYSHFVSERVDCDAHKKLLEYGWKAVPYLVSQLKQYELSFPWKGAAAINEPSIKTPEQVYEWNHNRRPNGDFHLHIISCESLDYVLNEITGNLGPFLAPHRCGPVPMWIWWWQEQRFRYDLANIKDVDAGPLEDAWADEEMIESSCNNGLLALYANGATTRQIFERGVAEFGLELCIGQMNFWNSYDTIRFKSVTAAEFMCIMQQSFALGASYEIHGKQARIGLPEHRESVSDDLTELEESGRINLKYTDCDAGRLMQAMGAPVADSTGCEGWGIMMTRSTFAIGEDIPVLIESRTKLIVDPASADFPLYGGFRISRNDGTPVQNFSQASRSPDPSSLVQLPYDKHGRWTFNLLLNKQCVLPPGEYNVSFQYLDHRTPTMSIKVYTVLEGKISRDCYLSAQ